MSAPAAPPKAPPGPIAAPDEQFWEKYSPHYEFPLSSVGSVLMNVLALSVFLIALWLMARSTTSDKTPVPIEAQLVVPGDLPLGVAGKGGGGGTREEAVDTKDPTDPSQAVPETKLVPIPDDVKNFLPQIPEAKDAPRVQDLPAYKNLNKLNDELRKKLAPGAGGGTGEGTEPGMGPKSEPGAGSGGKDENAKTSAARTLRWVIDFRTRDTADYRSQLVACKAILGFEFPDGKLKVIKDLGAASPVAVPFEGLPGLYFIDEDNAVAMARELGLDFRPARFICFFPKEIEEELAAKEREHRGRKESEIFSTTFSIIIRNGKPEIRVTAQEVVRR
jgi:hypothetical protein